MAGVSGIGGSIVIRVALTPTIFTRQRFGGISRYFAALAAELNRLGIDVCVPGIIHQNEYLRQLPKGMTSALWAPLAEMRLTNVAEALNRFACPRMREFQRAVCVHETYYLPAVVSASQRLVITVYDMIHERFPQLFVANDPTSRQKAEAVRRADHIICISRTTADDLVERLPDARGKVTVVHLGCGVPAQVADRQNARPADRPYVLYVGHRGGYKNFSALVSAVASSPRLRRDLVIRVFGGEKLSRTERNFIRDQGLAADQVTHDGVNEERLEHLYRYAGALVYPSLYEGFGMPVLEAMVHECPVICSNASCLPEIAGPAAEYHDPRSPDDLARAIEAVVFSPSRRLELIELGRERAQRFSWQRCAEETLAVYRSLGCRE